MNRIIIAVDDSDRSEDAVAFGGLIARATNAPVTLVHVHPWGVAAVRLCEPYFTELTKTLFARLTPALGDVADAESCGLPGPARVSVLQELAERRSAGLIVVGSSHTGRHGRIYPGSTGERLLHGAPCPVAIVPVGFHATEAPALRTIGCPWNGSAASDAGLELAERLASATGASMRLIRVFEERDISFPSDIRVQLEAFTAGLRDDARQALDDKVTDLERRVVASGELRDGEPLTQLLAASEALDLLVIGSRGYGPLGAVLLGGVSGRLVRSAACPVIVVPNGASEAVGSIFPPRAAEAPTG